MEGSGLSVSSPGGQRVKKVLYNMEFLFDPYCKANKLQPFHDSYP